MGADEVELAHVGAVPEADESIAAAAGHDLAVAAESHGISMVALPAAMLAHDRHQLLGLPIKNLQLRYGAGGQFVERRRRGGSLPGQLQRGGHGRLAGFLCRRGNQ